jgi:hypothetical protein
MTIEFLKENMLCETFNSIKICSQNAKGKENIPELTGNLTSIIHIFDPTR